MGTVFITFIEMTMAGDWEELQPPYNSDYFKRRHDEGFTIFSALASAEIRLVEPEVVIRRFRFGPLSRIFVKNSVVMFDSINIEGELSVDEDLREGKRLKL